MYYNIAKRILCMSLKFCIVMYKYHVPVAFNYKIKYLYCIVLYCIAQITPLAPLRVRYRYLVRCDSHLSKTLYSLLCAGSSQEDRKLPRQD